MELSAIVSGIGILEGIISDAIYDLLKARLKKKSLTKDDVASIVFKALHETQDIYLNRISEMLRQTLGVQNETLVDVIVQRVHELLEKYEVPPIERGIVQTEEARRLSKNIAQDIGSHLIEHSRLFLLVSKEMLKGEDFKRASFIFAQTESFLGKSPKIFQQMLREYLAAVEEEAVRRSLMGDPENAIVLYEILLPPYRLILHDTEKAAEVLNRLAEYYLSKKDFEKAARYYKLLDRKKAIELYEKLDRYLDVVACYVLEGQRQEASKSFEMLQAKRREWKTKEKNVERRLIKLKKSGPQQPSSVRKLEKLEKKKLKKSEMKSWENFYSFSEQMDLDVEHLRLMEKQVKVWDTDYLSLRAIIEWWKKRLFGSYPLSRTPLKSEEQYTKEGLYHLAAILNLRSGSDDLARKYFEMAIEKFEKLGHKEALEGNFESFRTLLEKTCCQILAASTEIGEDLTAAEQDGYGWKKLREASTTLQIVFEIDHRKKKGARIKELGAVIVDIYHELRTRVMG